MMDPDQAKGTLILLAQVNFQTARWWQLAAVWLFGRHRIVRHLGRIARIGFWREQPYLLSFREVP
jgi:hypothetical protein